MWKDYLICLYANKFIELVAIAIVLDTIFGVLRAIKEHKFNSCFGIDGAIRKCGMLISLLFLKLVDVIVNINLISILPKEVVANVNVSTIGLTEFFALLYIAYEVVSILKNMTLCDLPVKKIWLKVRNYLMKYTDEIKGGE